jgi:hypothetical protein
MNKASRIVTIVLGVAVAGPVPALASGHGPVFGAATPTLGRGGWSIDQAWTCRAGDEEQRQQMLKTMLSFGIKETLQVTGSHPIANNEGHKPPARMMSALSSDREFEGLAAYRFQRRVIGIGGRQESTLSVGGTAPFEDRRDGFAVGPSLEAGVSTGYASRAHYVWVGGAVQHFLERDGDQLGDSRLVTVVYGYRPPALRTEAHKPDLRFFVEATAEDRGAPRVGGVATQQRARTVFVGPTSLLLHKAVGVEAGVLFPAYQDIQPGSPKERVRVAVNVAYFFWLK